MVTLYYKLRELCFAITLNNEFPQNRIVSKKNWLFHKHLKVEAIAKSTKKGKFNFLSLP